MTEAWVNVRASGGRLVAVAADDPVEGGAWLRCEVADRGGIPMVAVGTRRYALPDVSWLPRIARGDTDGK